MNTTRRLLWGMAALLMCVAGISCATENHDRVSNVTAERADLIARQLQQCPLWTEISEHDLKRREQITEMYLSLAQYDTATIRAGIVSYLNRSPVLSPQRYEAGAKIFAFLRVVFRVPRRFDAAREHVPFETAGNPVYPDGVDLLWPFSIDRHEGLQLTGVAIGLSGPAYNPLTDFDQMARRLPRRFSASR